MSVFLVRVHDLAQVCTDQFTIKHAPLSIHHHGIGFVSAANDQRGDRITRAAEPRFVQSEQRQVCRHARQQTSEVFGSSQQSR